MADKETPAAPQAPVAPAAPEAPVAPAEPVEPAAPEVIDVELHTPFTTNGVVYGRGATADQPVTVQVEPTVAEDLLRRQAEYDRVEKMRFVSRSFTVNAGTLDAGK